MSSWAAYEIAREMAEEVRAAQERKPQGAPPDPARGYMEWQALQEKEKNSLAPGWAGRSLLAPPAKNPV